MNENANSAPISSPTGIPTIDPGNMPTDQMMSLTIMAVVQSDDQALDIKRKVSDALSGVTISDLRFMLSPWVPGRMR